MDYVGSVAHPTLSAPKPSLKDAPALSSLRIRKLQKYLAKNKIDGLLAVNGIDSRYSPDARHFINFILFGCSVYRSGSYTRQQTTVDTDELVLMIRQDKVHIYINSETYTALLPFLVKIPDLEVHCLDPALSVDENVVEDHKIYAFIAMTANAAKIAIPHTGKDFNSMAIEKWPIIQAYALENYGSNGFFGLTHEIAPLDFQDIYTSFDMGSLHHLLTEAASLLKYQWNLAIRNVASQLGNGAADLSGCLDPIRSYLSHGTGKEGVVFEQQAHPVTGAPLFLTLSVSQPALLCGRTYFIHSDSSADLVMLSILFDAMVATTQRSIQRFAATQNTGKIQSYFSKKFAEKLTAGKHPLLRAINLKSLKIKVEMGGFNVRGEAVDPASKNSLKTISVTIGGITSSEKPGVVFKPLVHCETFVDSHLQIESGESSADDAEVLVVTTVIPTFVQWNLASLGDWRESAAPCSILSSDHYEGRVLVAEGDLLVTSPFSTPLTIPLSAIKEVRVNKSGISSISLFVEHTADCLPPFYKRFCLVFWQRAKAFKFASDTLLPLLKEAGVAVNGEPLPPDVEIQVSALSRGEGASILDSAYPTLPSFSPHLMLSSHGSHTYNQRDINPSMVPDTSEPSVFITLLIGIPGSNQEKICSLLTESCPQHQFIVLRQPLGAPELFSPANLRKSLQTLAARGGDPLRVVVIVSAYVSPAEVISSIVQHPDSRTRRACHVAAVNTCVDLRNVFLCNRTMFPKLLEQCQEGWTNAIIVSGQRKGSDERLAILRKVNPDCRVVELIGNNFLSAEDLEEICALDAWSEPPLPVSRHLSSPGWYSPNFTDRPPFLSITHLSVQFTGELCKARFMAHLKALHQKEGRVFVDRLAMNGSIFYLGGRTKFSEDPAVYSVEFTPRSEAISLTTYTKPLAPGTPHCFVFTGLGITETQVKSWLQSCTPRPPAKKTPLTKGSLSAEEKEQLRKTARQSALPEGWFYNGSHYVSLVDGKSMEHPVYGELVERYVKEKNGEVEKWNEQVEKFQVLSLFDGI